MQKWADIWGKYADISQEAVEIKVILHFLNETVAAKHGPKTLFHMETEARYL